jgi:hypothetical protein
MQMQVLISQGAEYIVGYPDIENVERRYRKVGSVAGGSAPGSPGFNALGQNDQKGGDPAAPPFRLLNLALRLRPRRALPSDQLPAA